MSDTSSVSWCDDRERYERLAADVSEVIVLTTKDGWFWRVVATALAIVSFGRFSRQQFLDRFASTLGPVQAYPRSWPELSPLLIVHEGRHTQQFLKAGWLLPPFGLLGPRVRCWAGVLPMAVLYGFFPLPVFFAWGRFRLELDADAHAWQTGLRQGWLTADEVRERAEWFAETVSSWAYLKAWPTSWTRAAFRRRAEAIIAAHQSLTVVSEARIET